MNNIVIQSGWLAACVGARMHYRLTCTMHADMQLVSVCRRVQILDERDFPCVFGFVLVQNPFRMDQYAQLAR